VLDNLCYYKSGIQDTLGDHIGLGVGFLQSYLNRPIIILVLIQDLNPLCIFILKTAFIVIMANRDFARTGRLINAASGLFGETPKPCAICSINLLKLIKCVTLKSKNRMVKNEQDTTDIYYH
jgi:hypothetical protein